MLVEYDIVDHCNLNCKNCGHFSHLKSRGEKSIEDIRREISLLISKLPVTEFKIVGGEPLIHSDICGVMRELRRILGSDTSIELTTNGLKLTSMSDYFFVLASTLNISITVSNYPVGTNHEKMQELLTSHRIKHVIYDVQTFYDFVDITGSQDGNESFRLCRKKIYCPFYDGKKIYLCAYSSNAAFVNSKYGSNIEYNSVDIVNDTAETIKAYLEKPCPTCRFCKSGRQPEKWMRYEG